MRRSAIAVIVLVVAVVGAALLYQNWPQRQDSGEPLKIAIAPYQDLAMMVNAEPLGLERKYGTDIELLTMGWEDIPPAVASAGRSADIGFGSYIEYLTKYQNLNAGSDDPVLFIYPLYVFKGGAFVSFDERLSPLSRSSIDTPGSPDVLAVLRSRIGVQRASVYEMIILDLAKRHGVDATTLRITDTPLDQAFLAAQRGDLDVAEAGLTQLAEARRRGGRVIMTMDDVGFADITGFIVKKSVYEARRRDIDNAIRMWFDSVAFVYADIDRNSAASLDYLNRNASTRYTLAEYKAALEQEYLPLSLDEAQQTFIAPNGRYSAARIGTTINDVLVRERTVSAPTPLPVFPEIR